MDYAMLTHVGRCRVHNEDTCAADEMAGLFVVCDGMGGAAGGEVASQLAARAFLEQARAGRDTQSARWRLEKAAMEANNAVFMESHRDMSLRGMGTTLVGMEIGRDLREAWIVNVGDSRCYRLRDGVLEQLTHDHSFVDEQVRAGLMTVDEASISHLRNIITRAVGSHVDVDPDVVRSPLMPGDLFLLCSDGLTREADDEAIAQVLNGHQCVDLQMCANALVALANECGGSDNITVVLVRI
ncbi:protein phosphatase [Terriglobus roseus]|uniref:Protein phosphatase n=1 Tax=Terriglobus roseus TaxID=392734 RepID=A0A1G7EXK8_9BACT|nr:protein phosphatase [Terriglobus roseus]